jgi:hypothetical protein
MTTENNNPRYTGLVKYTSEQDGYALWLPTGWHSFEMGEGRIGMIFSPFPTLPAPAFSVEKTILPFVVSQKDLPLLREGFRKGLANLPGVAIETQDEVVEEKILALEARLIFLDQGQTKKRWIRVIYAGEAQLTLIAEGAPPEEFEYWLPMFYNIMTTMTI